jgi:uncharacterized protein with ATP-grasp and redox domains
VRLKELECASESDIEKLEVAKKVIIKLIEDFNFNYELTRLATNLYKYLVTLAPSVVDYYKSLKRTLNQLALRDLKVHDEYVFHLSDYDRFRYLVKLSALGNLIDYGVAEHAPTSGVIEPQTVVKYEVAVDHISDLYEMVSGGNLKIAWLFDNAGEAVYDTLLIRELRSLGNRVIGLMKSEPGFQNDLTIEDAVEIGLDKVLDRVVSYGARSTIHLEDVNKEVLEAINEADLIVAKGMSNYENLIDVELEKPIFFILIPKCNPVASSIGKGSKGRIVVKRKEGAS